MRVVLELYYYIINIYNIIIKIYFCSFAWECNLLKLMTLMTVSAVFVDNLRNQCHQFQ